MVASDSTHPHPSPTVSRARVAGFTVAALTVAYALLSVWYFYEDFFKFLQVGAVMTADRSGWMVSVDYPYLWSILSPWRVGGAALTVILLAISAEGLWRGRARARAGALITLWGVLLPQVFWATEFVVDWHQSQHLFDIVLGALLTVAVPTALIFRGSDSLRDWNPARGSLRLLSMAIALCWLAFGATEFLDHAYHMPSWSAFGGAAAAAVLGALAARGLFSLKAWALWAGVGAAVALALVPLSATWTSLLPYGGYMEQTLLTTSGTDTRIAMSMLIPLAIVWGLGAPYLHGFVRKLRS
ncbi:MAG: hypothetical protein Tsb0020_27100 [Haliangiales bacterium]